jgi:uncharacterized membrane protein YbaN (DUF454 family)
MRLFQQTKRCALVVLGLLFVAIGFFGIFLPGIPTTGPLLLASVLLTKSCPALERRLIRNRFFGRYVKYLDASHSIPRKARIWGLIWMWTSISVSTVLLLRGSSEPWFIASCMFLAGLVGSCCILTFRREKQPTSLGAPVPAHAENGSKLDADYQIIVELRKIQDMTGDALRPRLTGGHVALVAESKRDTRCEL